MQVLLIETATEKSALILAQGEKPLAVKYLTGGAELSKCLASEVKQLLDLHQFRPDLIAVGRGPGSYTGVRVGLALGQALSYGWKIPLTGFVSLQAFAPPADGPFAVLLDARSGGFYALLGERSSGGLIFEEPRLLSVEEASKVLNEVHHIGSPHPSLIQNRFKDDKIWFETQPDPKLLARLVLDADPTHPEPIYCGIPAPAENHPRKSN